MKRVTLLLFSLLLMNFARANLGDSPDEFRARYGPGEAPTETKSSTAEEGLRQQRFTAKGYQIAIHFSDVSLQESYFPDTAFTDDQIETLLEANSEGHRWKKRLGTEKRSWIREDGAEADLTESCFIFRSRQLLDREKEWNNLRTSKAQSL